MFVKFLVVRKDTKAAIAGAVIVMEHGETDGITNAAGEAEIVTYYSGVEAGGTGGSDTHTLTTAEMPSHTHTSATWNSYHANTSSGGGNTANDGITGLSGGGLAHNNMQPYLGVNYIISI